LGSIASYSCPAARADGINVGPACRHATRSDLGFAAGRQRDARSQLLSHTAARTARLDYYSSITRDLSDRRVLEEQLLRAGLYDRGHRPAQPGVLVQGSAKPSMRKHSTVGRSPFCS